MRSATEGGKQWREDDGQSRGAVLRPPSPPPPSPVPQLAQDLLASGCIRFGQFTLKSGLLSPIYLDLRRLVSYPAVLRRVAQAYVQKLSALKFDRLAGIPYAGLPIATAVALEMNRPLIYPRRETKDYGTKAVIEGDFNAGETAVVIDDLATTGETKIESIQKLEAAAPAFPRFTNPNSQPNLAMPTTPNLPTSSPHFIPTGSYSRAGCESSPCNFSAASRIAL